VKTRPRFSVVICNYNYAALVGDAIRSALGQDYPQDLIEVIAVDDGSTDGSRDVYPEFEHDSRFHLVLQENRGQTAAYAAGVRVATGDLVCLLDSDDVYLPHKLSRVAAHIATLDEAAEQLFLCHDLSIENVRAQTPGPEQATWFAVTGINRLPDLHTLDQSVQHFPFSIPCGLVFSRGLIANCLEALPSWDFRNGTDGVLCPAVFLQIGRVHYLRETLGVYRIHGGNEFASMVDGRYIPRFNPLSRAPKTQRFLEHWVDLCEKSADARALALQYLRNREHLLRRPSASRGLREPKVQVMVLAGTNTALAHESVQRSQQSHGNVAINICPQDSRSELATMAAAWRDNDAEYVVFMRAGDLLDREFVERHLHLRRHGALVGLSCSDVRLVSPQDSLVHADVMRNSGAWKQPLQPVPPMVTGLRDWVASPWSSGMFQRGALLDRLFASAASAPTALQDAGFWLACQFAHHTAGILRIRETLTSFRLADGAGASYGYLSVAGNAQGRLIVPPVQEAAAWLNAFYRQEEPLLQQWLPPAWHARFRLWLAAQTSASPPIR
jgi:glycosyltransferase involved in cell wall biosynthesis